MWYRNFGAKVTGITISEKQFRYAQSTAAGISPIDFVLGNAADTGLPAESFDVVTAMESSEHMPDKAKFFAEAHRLLRRDGRCVIAAWLTRDQPRSWESSYLVEPICREGRLPSMASMNEYQDFLEHTGFRHLNFLDLTRNVKRTWNVCALRVIERFFQDSSFRRVLFDRRFTNRIFAKTIFRIWLAYQIGAMRFGLFSAQK
jgi:tocopherol O-methyltransferase